MITPRELIARLAPGVTDLIASLAILIFLILIVIGMIVRVLIQIGRLALVSWWKPSDPDEF